MGTVSLPGGRNARPGWTDATLCDGAPVYQRQGVAADGAVLYRMGFSYGSTQWVVGPSSNLGDCNGDVYYRSKTTAASTTRTWL